MNRLFIAVDIGGTQIRAALYDSEGNIYRRVADLAGGETIETAYLAEAIQYRPRRQV